MKRKKTQRSIRVRHAAIWLPALVGCMTFAPATTVRAQQSSVQQAAGSVGDIIRRLEKKWPSYRFLYDYDQLKTKPAPRGIQVDKQNLEETLKSLNEAGVISYRISGNAVSISQAPSKQSRPGTVSGKVLDEDNKPVVGATVMIGGQGIATNEDGTFSLSVPEGSYKAMVSYIGHANSIQDVTVPGGGRAILNASLTKDASQLQDVVVTALGISRQERALGYAVTKVDGDELNDALSNNWTNALTGKVAGLNLLKSGGGPSGSNKIVLRGENSLDGNSAALIVVDGVIISNSSGRLTGMAGSGAYLDSDSPVDFGSSLNDLNPEDIESVSVLKGPGASALYGARGANGAIIVTTKSGKRTTKGLGVTVNSNVMFETVSRWPDYQYEYGQGASGQDSWYSYNATADGASTRSTSSAWGPRFDGQSYFQYDPATRTTGATRTPWVPYENNRKDFFQTGRTFTNSVTLEGGNAQTSARLSLTNLDNTWIIPNTGYKRNTVALSVNQKVSQRLSIATKVNYTNKKSDNLPMTGYNNQSIMYFIRGMVPNSNLDWFRDYWTPGQEQISQTRPFSSLLDNPYLIANEMLNTSDRHGVIGNISATYNFTDKLSLLVRSALDYSTEARSQRRPKGVNKFVDGMYREQDIFAQEINSDFLLSYKTKIRKDFTANVSFGGAQMRNTYRRNELRADKLLYPGVYNFANSKNTPVALPYRAKYSVNSFYGLAQFSFRDWLYMDLTGRNDWFSTLATPTSAENTGSFYPSVNMSAVLTDALQLPKAISFLKARGSWAAVGSGGTTPFLKGYSYVPAASFPSGLLNPSALPDSTLAALRTHSVEFGVDARFFQNRLGIDVAVYQNNTRDQIFNVPIDRASGYSSTIINAGKVQNKGLEIQLNAAPLKSAHGLNWNIFGTYATNRNKVISLTDSISTYVMSTGPANRGSIEARPGGRLGDLYGLGYLRSPDGQIVYNAQGLAQLTDTMLYLGNTTPLWKASIGSEFGYKNFHFKFLFDGQFGGKAYSLTHSVLADEGKLTKTLPGRYNGIIGDGVQSNGDGTYRPNDVVATNIQAYYSSHFTRDNIEANTFSTDFIKLREVRLDYVFTPKLLKAIKFQRASIGIYGRDLFMITNWPSFDPEFGTLGVNTASGDGQINAGFEIGQFPSTRSYGIDLTVGF